MLIGTAQMKMGWTTEENVDAIIAAIEQASDFKADLLVFPELALTGFHRKIREEVDKVARNPSFFERIQKTCAIHQQAIWLGHPEFIEDSIYNAYSIITNTGDVLSSTHKLGLLPGEKQLFEMSNQRPITLIQQLRLGAVICREVGDLNILRPQLKQADVLVWPGYVRNEISDTANSGEPVGDGTKEQACDFTKGCDTALIQCNWAHSLNRPELKDLGGSSYIDNQGVVRFSCPWNEAGIGFFDLTTNRCVWKPDTK